MNPASLGPAAQAALDEMLGYLNFSTGASDSRFQKAVNELYRQLELDAAASERPWVELHGMLAERLDALIAQSEAFRESEQVKAVLAIVFEHLLPAYPQYHRDLLHHQEERTLFRPFFVTRACEAVLRQGSPWDQPERIVEGAMDTLNDFLGYRPVAVLNTPQKIEPYAHEWVCPIPLYLRGAGVAVDRYHDLIQQTLDILGRTDRNLLEQAWFDLELLDELALDPRAYDFDHPVNKRPNHHFGQWDPHRLDNQGRYRRFVVQGITLDAIWQRTEESSELPVAERLFEGAAVLAGTILMAAAVGGRGPESHDSGTTLSKLLPRIASFRDEFYERLLAAVPGRHGERLREEAKTLRQPFGGARQHLNTRLARLRATQLQHVHLAQLFARMGYPDASLRQAQIVSVASARMLCEINTRLTGGHHAIDRGRLDLAGQLLPEIEDLIHRAIECGAIVDPWNILGFQGHFSLFPAVENSIWDHRVDVLIHLLRQVFGLFARLEGEAAAVGDRELQARLDTRMGKLARWWDKYASAEVSGLERLVGSEAAESARHVATALGAWHAAGASAGDIAFWREHVERFNSPKAYALVVQALLQKHDFIAARALLIQWLAQCDQAPLAETGYSFHDLSLNWLRDLYNGRGAHLSVAERFSLTKKFFDFLEANAEEWWEIPRFEWEKSAGSKRNGDEADGRQDDFEGGDEDDEERQNLFQAAYEEMVYRDTTADGVESETLDGGGQPTDAELDWEATRIGKRLAFLVTLARLWKMAATCTLEVDTLPENVQGERRDVLRGWFSQAVTNRQRLLELVEAVQRHPLPKPKGSTESHVEYDRCRIIKESLLARIINTAVETSDAARVVLAALDEPTAAVHADELAPWELAAVPALRALYRGDASALREAFPPLRAALDSQPILYVPLAKNGCGKEIVAAQTVQQLLTTLLKGLPRSGLLCEACQLLATVQGMEKHRPTGEGAVTEFDRMFEVGYLAIVESLVDAAGSENDERIAPSTDETSASDADLIEGLQSLTEPLLKRWLDHSKSLRLSVLEKLADKDRWKTIVQFIQDYGGDLFKPRFLNLGNLRAILHQSVNVWLRQLQDEDDEESSDLKLLADLDGTLNRQTAVECLTLIIEALVENYAEYKDFNSTTTQSDRGELMYMLLDVLRLKASYDRFSWNIKPVVMAHEVLVRRGKLAAAELWRRAVAQKTGEYADWHLKRLAELTKQYGMRLPTVVDRLNERFVRPLAIDRMRALIPQAIDDVRQGRSSSAFEVLEDEINEFAEHPTGAGLDVPAWLEALEQEADNAGARREEPDEPRTEPPPIPQVKLSWEEVLCQLRTWEGPNESL